MKNTNTINNEMQEKLKFAILVAARMREPSAEQLAKEQKECEEYAKRNEGGQRIITHPIWEWYKNLMDNLEISEEYYTGKGVSSIDIVESFFRFAEFEENNCYGVTFGPKSYPEECTKLIAAAGLDNEFAVWKAERQVYDRNGQVVRVGDIIRFPNITEIFGHSIENGYEAKIHLTKEGLVWIGHPENAWLDDDEHLHLPGIPLTAEHAKCAEVVIAREEGFVRHPHRGDFVLPRLHVPGSGNYEMYVKLANSATNENN